VLASVTVVATGGAAFAAAPAKPQKSTTPPRDPGEESLAERRAVRGSPVDECRFPRRRSCASCGASRSKRFRAAARRGRRPSTRPCPRRRCPGSWGGSGDVPPELRSPDAAARGQRDGAA
jgi:hypothetical protein